MPQTHQTFENIHSGLSGLRNDQKWKDVLNFRFANRRTMVVKKKACLLARDAGFHTIVNGLNGHNYAIGTKESWGFVGADQLCFYRLWRLRQEYRGVVGSRSEESQRLIVRGKYTGNEPKRIRVTVVKGRLVLAENWPNEPEPQPEPEVPDYGCNVNALLVTISGTVFDGDHPGQRLEGALVEFRQDGQLIHTASANSNGDYFIPDVAPGIYDMTISYEGYGNVEAHFEILTDVSRVDVLYSQQPCGALVESGGQGYEEHWINLGTGTGTVQLDFDALDVPDKFEVVWNGNTVINTGFRGDPSYDSQLIDAGYPATSGLGAGTASFVKNTTHPVMALVKITAPLDFTVWSFTLNCPA